MSSLKRISAGAGANVVNLVYQIVIVGISVPVLAGAWGVEQYGVWVMLTAVPAYLALSDFGFSTAATNDIAMHYARGATDKAVEVLHSVWTLSLIVSAAIVGGLALLVAGAGLWAPKTWPLNEFGGTILLLGVYAVLNLTSRTILGVFRATGHYARGTLVYDALQFIEGCTYMAAAWFGGGFIGAAAAMVIVRTINLVSLAVMLKVILPDLPLGFAGANVATLKRLVKPAAASMAIPISMALNMQGVALVVGAVVSPTATAVLSATRTVSRVAVQVISAVNRAMIPELSAASATGNVEAQRRIARINTLMLVFAAAPAAGLFGVLGPWAIGIWTAGAMHPSSTVAGLLGLAMLLHCIWFFGTNLLSATNAHGRMAIGLLGASVLAIVLAAGLSRFWGLPGACIGVVVGEAACVAWFYFVGSRPAPAAGQAYDQSAAQSLANSEFE